MLMLAVAAGESGANPELSRNGVPGALSPARESDDLPTARPVPPFRTPRRPGLAVGPVDAVRSAAFFLAAVCPRAPTLLPPGPPSEESPT
ncbi:hypothetical protein GCM10020367_42890 [Streptomyces sannanensis]|uniref:Uncharacterized protein n=1 Tax=Streptomyces sannanensis TaxID=285536 RepID=A0ABP6SFM0_9ACTN